MNINWNRHDVKWAHPGAIGPGNWALEGLSYYMDSQLEMDAEEFTASRDEERKNALDLYMANMKEKNKLAGDWLFDTAKGCPEEPDTMVPVSARIPKSSDPNEKFPCIFDIAGGGLCFAGSYEYYMKMDEVLSKHHNAVVVSLCYRLCEQAKYPGAVNDCHAAYLWVLENADRLHIDTNKIIIHGLSTGGHLALSLGFRLKRYGIKPRGIVTVVPVMDDTFDTESGNYSYRNPEDVDSIDAWDGELARVTQKAWLGDLYGSANLSPEAIPAKATVEDLKGYPPVWISATGELDPSRDAVIDFAKKCYTANVFCDFHVWGGCNHNTTAPDTEIGKAIGADTDRCLQSAINYDLGRSFLA